MKPPAILLALLAALNLGACDKLPERPAEATYKAADDYERCRLTAARAILCSDEIMVAQLRAIPGLDGSDGMAELVETDLADDKPKLPKQDRKERIELHKTTCQGDGNYADAVFACWSIEDCKKFATCVAKAPTAPAKSR
jgi:hypothetical protein